MSGIRTLKPDEKLIIVCPDDVTTDEVANIKEALSEMSSSNFLIATERYSFYIVPKGGSVELKHKLA